MSTTVSSRITVRCDSPTCNTEITWVEQEVQQDPNALPDGAYRLLVLQQFSQPDKKAVFCSHDCLRRAMKNYVPPLSPREQAVIAETNVAAEAAKEKAEKVVEMPSVPVPAVEQPVVAEDDGA